MNPSPTVIPAHIAAALLGAAIAASCAWQIQSWRLGGQLDALKAQHSAEQARAAADARAAEIVFNNQLQEAQDAATQRETKLRADAAAAHRAADGLRGTLAAVRADLPSYSQPAAVATADAAAELLGQCADQYREVAEAADRHATDALMLRQAWPLNPRRPDGGTTESKP